jgi:small subunit ribosomal protein S11
MSKKPTKKKIRKIVISWKCTILASYNNTIVTFTENNWNVLTWSTAWSSGFKWARKSTPYAGQIAAQNASEKAKAFWLKEVMVYVKWIWPWREQSIRWIIASWIEIVWIVDVTPLAHNGCRQKWVRRV